MKFTIIQQLNERAPQEAIVGANILIGIITSELAVEEMRTSRGKDFDATKFYQLRIKPKVKDSYELQDIQNDLEKLLKSKRMQNLGVTNVAINERSFNSGKFTSVSFSFGGIDYDTVIALGGNKGESFEKDMLLKMDNYIVAALDKSHKSDDASIEEAKAAFDALEEADPEIKVDDVVSVSPRAGKTQRSGDLSPEETGAIIADIVVHLKSGKKKYISLKNENGSTVAQFGLAKAFNDDFSVNTDTSEWKTWLAPFKLDPQKLKEGMEAARDQTSVKWEDVEKAHIDIKPSTEIFKMMEKMWGSNYIYLRQKGKGFYALNIDTKYVRDTLLKDLKVTEIRYPSKARKQVTISLESSYGKFKLEVRNPRGKGVQRLTQIQLSVAKKSVAK